MTRARALALGLALVASAGGWYVSARGSAGTVAVIEGEGRYRDGRGRVGREGSSSASPGFALLLSYLWPTTATDRIPLCTDDATCVAVCGIGVATGSATAWECKGNDGLSFGTVMDPGGTTIDSFIVGTKAREFLHDGFGNPATVTSATLDAVFAAGAPYTVVAGGFGRANGDGYNWLINRKGGTSGNFNLYLGPGNKSICSGSNVVADNTGQPLDGYGFLACSRSGGTNYKAYYQYDETSVTDAAAEPSIAGTGAWTIGDRSAAAGSSLGLGGPIVFVAFYNTQKTAAQIAAIREKYQGSYNAAGSVGYLSAQNLGIDNTATTGNVDMIFAGSAVVDPRGLVTTTGFTNFAAAGTVLNAAGVDVGTPTVTPAAAAGPFKTWLTTNDCALVADNDAAAFEGKQGLTSGTALGWNNASAYAMTGTSGTTTTKMRIAWDVPSGTATPASCDFTVTATPARYECPALITGSPTSIKASWLVGNAATDTGSIRLCQQQHTIGAGMEPPVPNGSATGAVHYTLAPTTDGWPTASAGAKYEVVHTPKYDPDTQWYSAAVSTYYLFDPTLAAGATHAGTLIFGYQNPGGMYAQAIVTAGVGLTAGQAYATSLEWRPVGGGNCNFIVRHNSCGATPTSACVATTQVNADTTGTLACPGQPDDCTLGVRNQGSAFPLAGYINAVRIYR